jgi:hypothetical protein
VAERKSPNRERKIKIRLKVSIFTNFHWDRSTYTEKGREVEKEQREGKIYKPRAIKRAREIKRQTETESDIKI